MACPYCGEDPVLPPDPRLPTLSASMEYRLLIFNLPERLRPGGRSFRPEATPVPGRPKRRTSEGRTNHEARGKKCRPEKKV